MDRRHFLDKRRARFLAGLIAVLALTGTALTYYSQQRTDTAGRAGLATVNAEATKAPSANPKFEECRIQRTGDIANMLKEGVIDQAKHDDFLASALQTCAGMFPTRR
jgi:hypothetical protein